MFASRPLCYDGRIEGIGELAGRHGISVVRGCVQETTERPRWTSASWAPIRLKLLGNKRKQILRTWSVYRRVSDAYAFGLQYSDSPYPTCILRPSAFLAATYTNTTPRWRPTWKLSWRKLQLVVAERSQYLTSARTLFLPLMPHPVLTVWQWRGHPHLVACPSEGACFLYSCRTTS